MGASIVWLATLSACSLYFGPQGGGADPGLDTGAAQPTIPKRMFVTSTRYPGGSLGGLVGADAKCNERAAVAGMTGEFSAWLSDASTSAGSRMTHSSGVYTLVDGTLVAQSWQSLVSGELERAIDRDETNQPYDSTVPYDHPNWNYTLNPKPVWTGTMYDGRDYAQRSYCLQYTDGPDCACYGWNSTEGRAMAGDALSVTVNWSEGEGVMSCVTEAALYCVEQ